MTRAAHIHVALTLEARRSPPAGFLLRPDLVSFVVALAQDALEQTSGTGIILGAGCVLLTQHSDATLVDLVQSLGGTVKLMGVKPQ